MIRIRKGIVREIISDNGKVSVIRVQYDNTIEKALNYSYITGTVYINDTVYINTSANYLGLGTGGYNFVMINETRGYSIDIDDVGHIMKLKYTPYQVKCCCTSEQDNICHQTIKDFKDLGGMVTITGELHSMLAPTACTIKYINNNIKLAYIMTDGGSLSIDLSKSVEELKRKGIIYGTITCGNAFGGDFEAVNIYDALAIAFSVLNCDIAVVTMGPGITGTGTKYGFSGIEQGHIIDCINTLKGTPVFIPRISFSDLRERHHGISHHTLTVLSEVSKTPAHVVLPVLHNDKSVYMESQINNHDIQKKHIIKYIESNHVYEAVRYYGVSVSTMGRNIKEDNEFFLSCSSAAYYANSVLSN